MLHPAQKSIGRAPELMQGLNTTTAFLENWNVEKSWNGTILTGRLGCQCFLLSHFLHQYKLNLLVCSAHCSPQLKDLKPLLESFFQSKPRRILDVGCGILASDGELPNCRLGQLGWGFTQRFTYETFWSIAAYRFGQGLYSRDISICQRCIRCQNSGRCAKLKAPHACLRSWLLTN